MAGGREAGAPARRRDELPQRCAKLLPGQRAVYYGIGPHRMPDSDIRSIVG